ncbi:MAG TPA: hypothetical protein VH350_03355 [Candidatus Sulfotelmatobacter sp.]|nr:hypothetical protein [Candidatus Sulfotelmatobacter sp.]
MYLVSGKHGNHIDFKLLFLKNYSPGKCLSPPVSVMELLLNVAWLLLALPAFWLWRSSKAAPVVRKFTALQCLLALGCMLVVLFPVVSATDDLRAMRSEMEESPASKRTVRTASNDKTSSWKWQNPPALVSSVTFLIVSDGGRRSLPVLRISIPASPVIERAARAPPVSSLS